MSYTLIVDLNGVPGKVLSRRDPATGEEFYRFQFDNSTMVVQCDKDGAFGYAGCSYSGHLADEILSYCPDGTRYRSDDDLPDEWQQLELDAAKRAFVQRRRAEWEARHRNDG